MKTTSAIRRAVRDTALASDDTRGDFVINLLDDFEEVVARAGRLKQVLAEIERPKYGLEMGDSADARAKYWEQLALQYRSMARRAIASDRGTPP